MLYCTNGIARRSVQYYHSLGERQAEREGDGLPCSDVVSRSAALISALLRVLVPLFGAVFNGG